MGNRGGGLIIQNYRRYQMFSMTKSRELDEVQTPFNFVRRRHYGEDVKFTPWNRQAANTDVEKVGGGGNVIHDMLCLQLLF